MPVNRALTVVHGRSTEIERAVDFADLQSGEAFAFSTDIDPTSIKGAQGTGAAGSVSGLELAGVIVTVEYVGRTSLAARLATCKFGFVPTVSAELVIHAFAFLV